jgi:hypothetical protein
MNAARKAGGMRSRHVLTLLVVIASAVAAFPVQALAAPPLVAGISAEGMTLPAGASNVRDRAADGGRAAQFSRNGTAATTLTTGAAVTSLTLSARGTRCSSSWPQVQLTIDGVSALSTAAGTTAWTTYSATGLNVPAGVHTISIVASNIASTRSCDRYLIVDRVSLYGAEAPPPPPPTPVAGCAATIIPAYSYPNPPTFWDNSIAGANPVQFMIADPASGPGRTRDANYTSVIARARAAGIRVMGYVDTDYARRSQSSMRADITTWKTLYNVTDIFFDQTASSPASLAYYQAIADVVHATPGALTMLNPGINVDERYLQMADILNIFEGSSADYAAWAPAAWVANYPAKRFSHLIYGVPDAASMTTVLNQALTRQAGYVYITSDVLPNPWDVLPPYWTTEIAQIRQACAATAPPAV